MIKLSEPSVITTSNRDGKSTLDLIRTQYDSGQILTGFALCGVTIDPASDPATGTDWQLKPYIALGDNEQSCQNALEYLLVCDHLDRGSLVLAGGCSWHVERTTGNIKTYGQSKQYGPLQSELTSLATSQLGERLGIIQVTHIAIYGGNQRYQWSRAAYYSRLSGTDRIYFYDGIRCQHEQMQGPDPNLPLRPIGPLVLPQEKAIWIDANGKLWIANKCNPRLDDENIQIE